MSEEDRRYPDKPKPPEVHTTPLILFDEKARVRRRSSMGRLGRYLAVVLSLLALGAAWWVYRTRRAQVPAPEEPATAQRTDATPYAKRPTKLPEGVIALSDSVLSGPVGSSVTLTTRAIGAGGLPVAGGLMRFRVAGGTGTLEPDTVRTDGEGLAKTSLTLPSRPGRIVVAADLVDAETPGARFRVTAQPGAPRHAVIVQGDRQSAPPGDLLPRSLGVRVTDRAGTPVPGADVRFQILGGGGGGVVAPTLAQTDTAGYAFARWRLGSVPGDQHVAALIPEIPDTLLTFTATAVSPPQPQPEAPTVDDRPRPVTVAPRPFAVGGNFVCALSGGRVSCRGADDRGQRPDRAAVSFVALAAGVSHACGLTREGQALCWGANDSGQLGDGSRVDRPVPAPVASDARFSTIAAGVSHTCGLEGEGQVLCWGSNADGQLGDGSHEDRMTPGPVSGDQRFVELVAGWNHTCGLTATREAFCWGLNDHGQLGDGSLAERLVPTRVPDSFESLVAGSAHTCGISGGEVLCWGDDTSGQLGDGATRSRPRPALVHGLPAPVTQLAAGAVSTCALLADGRAYCWGQNVHGELGDGTRDSRATPSPVSGNLRFRSIYAGGALTCGFTTAGVQYCWGLNQSGELGDGTRESRAVPTRVGG